MRSAIVFWALSCLTCASLARAAGPGGSERVAVAVKVTTAPQVDGFLNEEVWASAPKIGGFLQRDPREGEPATEPTEVRVVYTDRSLFFGVICHDSNPGGVLARDLQRDSEFDNDDSISILLDTFHDHRNAFLFRTNPLGTQYDALITDEGRIVNTAWDEKWEVVARINEQGWTVEIEIPLKTLRVVAEKEQIWGIDFERIIRRKNEWTYWSNHRRGFNFRQVSQAGHLQGLENLQTGLTWRIKPFVRAGLNHTHATTGESSDLDSSADIGLEDIKYRVTPNFTLDFTANTDFAETDVDEQVLNLTRFPVFFPEKREFFLEGAGIFDYGPGGGASSELKLFFSRRIGLSPEGESIPILWGTKFTGKAGRWTLGMIDMQTDQFGEIPGRNFGVLRVKRDLFGRSNAGVIFTSRDSGRSVDPYNRAAGADANFIFRDHLNLSGFLSRTYSPDNDKDAWAGRIRSFWDSDFIYANVEYLVIGRDFNPEIGWLPRRDMKKTKVQLDVKPRPDSEVIRQFGLKTNFDYITSQAGRLETRNQDFSFDLLFQSGDRILARFSRLFDRIRRQFRIGGLVSVPEGDYQWNSLAVHYFPGPHRRVSGPLIVRSDWGFYGGSNLQATWQPVIKVSRNLSLNPAYQFSRVSLPRGNFKSHVVNSRINFAFNRRWLTSTTVQYNSSGNFAGVNFRLNYIYRPGDNFFLVYNQFHALGRGLFEGSDDRALILKLTHSFDF